MSSEPVARWLGTFECRQYADHFHKCGFDTLTEVCKLTVERLQAMGINPIDTDKILENVFVLRQTLQGASQAYTTRDQFSSMPSIERRILQSRPHFPKSNLLSQNLYSHFTALPITPAPKPKKSAGVT